MNQPTCAHCGQPMPKVQEQWNWHTTSSGLMISVHTACLVHARDSIGVRRAIRQYEMCNKAQRAIGR